MRARSIIAICLCTMSACSATETPPTYDGQALYFSNCANCHGTYGEGDGAVSPALEVVLQDLRYLTARSDGFPREWLTTIIDGREYRQAHGPVGMPVWGDVFTSQEGYDEAAQQRVDLKVSALVNYLESMQILRPVNDEAK